MDALLIRFTEHYEVAICETPKGAARIHMVLGLTLLSTSYWPRRTSLRRAQDRQVTDTNRNLGNRAVSR